MRNARSGHARCRGKLDQLADDSHGLSFAQVGDVVTLAVTIAQSQILALMRKKVAMQPTAASSR